MNDFFKKMMETKGYLRNENSSLEIFGNSYEFFIFESFEIGELKK